MQPLHFPVAATAAALLTACLALAGCSGSSSSATASPSTAPQTSAAPQPSATSTPTAPSTSASSPGISEPTTGAGATQSIESNWAMFFDAKTSVSGRLALLQDGSTFASVIKAQASSPLALTATSKVTHVSLAGPTQASVTYEILVAGNVALANQSGVAVYQDGIWKVGLASFCGLLKLENAGSAKGLPAGCQG